MLFKIWYQIGLCRIIRPDIRYLRQGMPDNPAWYPASGKKKKQIQTNPSFKVTFSLSPRRSPICTNSIWKIIISPRKTLSCLDLMSNWGIHLKKCSSINKVSESLSPERSPICTPRPTWRWGTGRAAWSTATWGRSPTGRPGTPKTER